MGKQQQQQHTKSGGWGKPLRLPFLSAELKVRGAKGGESARAVRGPVGGSGRSSLRGWDIRDASFVAQPRAGGEEGKGYAEGAALLAMAPATCVALGLAQTPGQALGARSSSPPHSPSPFKESFEWSECEGACPRCGPLRPHTERVAPFVSFNSWKKASGPAVAGQVIPRCPGNSGHAAGVANVPPRPRRPWVGGFLGPGLQVNGEGR